MGFYSNSSVESRPFPSSLDFSAIMRQVYVWLALGLLVGFGVSFFVGNTALRALETAVQQGWTQQQLVSSSILFNPAVMIVSLILYIIMAFALYPVIMRASTTVGAIFYLAFTALFGFMISSIFLQYQAGTIAAAFVATAGMFGAMSIIGFTTKIDLSKFGSILMMALIGLLIASLVNLFLRSEAIYWIISYAGVLIFAGLTAYDTQWIKNNAAQVAATGNRDAAQRIALIGAFHLFLDFVNLFLFLLRILGSGNRNN